MNTFDRHLLREWLQILGLVLAATCGLLLVQVLYEDFRDLRDYGARGWVLWEYVAVRFPSFLPVVLPLALLISVLYVLGKLHRANELIAMRAAGVGILRMTLPIWIAGVLCCGLSWWLNTTIVPWSVERSRSLEESLRFQSESRKELPSDRIGATYSVMFDNQRAGRMWFFNRYSRFEGRAYGVSVHELDPERRETRRILAAQAEYDPALPGWRFQRGRELRFRPETWEQVGDRPFTELEAPQFGERPELMLALTTKPSDLSLFQLREVINHLEVEHSPKVTIYAVRYFKLIADTLGPLIVIAIAIPFAVAGVRVNPAVGVSKSIGLFFLYYLLSNFSTSLATRQVVDPMTAAWMPNGGMILLALWFFLRLR